MLENRKPEHDCRPTKIEFGSMMSYAISLEAGISRQVPSNFSLPHEPPKWLVSPRFALQNRTTCFQRRSQRTYLGGMILSPLVCTLVRIPIGPSCSECSPDTFGHGRGPAFALQRLKSAITHPHPLGNCMPPFTECFPLDL